MTFLMIFVAIIVVVSVLFFVLRRRMGMPMLGILAGYVLAEQWAYTAAAALTTAGIGTAKIPMQLVAYGVILAIPAFIIASKGYRVHAMAGRIVHSVAIGGLYGLLLLPMLKQLVVLDAVSIPLVQALTTYSGVLVAALILAALIDVLIKERAAER